MIAAQSTSLSFFRAIQQQNLDFEGQRFLTEVNARFRSEALLEEVRWRLEVLHELSSQRGMEAEFEVLRDRLTAIFTEPRDEQDILEQVRALTRLETRDGRTLDLRRFLVSERRVYNEAEYREVLRKKVENTQLHALHLLTHYPDERPVLQGLVGHLRALARRERDPEVRTRTLKVIEDNLRETAPYRHYEALKERELRDWLARFAGISRQELALLSEQEIQRLIQEHERHQTTRLVQAGVRPLETDISEHLGLHDTLEGEFRDEIFWEHATVAVRRGFREWVLRVVWAVGMAHGQRYAFFQSEADPGAHLLCGLALTALPTADEEELQLVPYLKPFTRKAGYLLEVRRRNLSDVEPYHAELRHYTLPFLFGFDQVPALEVPKALREFFNVRY